jgi:uncharacterized protein
MLAALLRLPQMTLIALVRAYRLLLSPWLGNSCRFEPTCSAYTLQALDEHGAAFGTCLALGRLARCHPWCEGGVDLVPARRPALFSSLVHGAAEGPATSHRPSPDKTAP